MKLDNLKTIIMKIVIIDSPKNEGKHDKTYRVSRVPNIGELVSFRKRNKMIDCQVEQIKTKLFGYTNKHDEEVWVVQLLCRELKINN